jgi:hypothetical protein
MYDPSSDLVLLKKLCVELQRKLAYSNPDRDKVRVLANDVKEVAESLIDWADE